MTTEIVKLEFRRFNASAAPALRTRLAAAWASGATVIALDFTEVASIDSLGVSALIAEHRRRPPNTKIVLCSLNDYVREVLEITQLVGVFDVYASPEAILKVAG
jgi:anti-sigma B factor antagonist